MALPYQATKIQAITEDWINPRLQDQIFGKGTRAWRTLSSRVESNPATNVYYPIRTGDITGATRSRAGNLSGTTTLTGTPATQVTLAKSYEYWNLALHDDDINENQGPEQIANYVATQTQILADSARTDMEGWIWTAQTSTYPASLVDAIDGVGRTGTANTYAGISTDDLPEWEAFTMESAHTTGTDTGVSPSLENVMKMLHTMEDYNGVLPDAGFCQGPLWDHLANLIAQNTYLAGVRQGYEVDWGTNVLRIGDVPIFRDRNVPGAAYDGTKATRALAKGYRLYFVTWDSFHLYATPGEFLQLGSWMRPADNNVLYLNTLKFSGNLICDHRRANGVIYNIDLSIPKTSHTEGSVYWNGALCT